MSAWTKTIYYVSRLLRETAIPLSEIEDVFLTTVGFVWVGVRFKSKTAFGRKIFFMPTLESAFIRAWQRYHPIVEELKKEIHNFSAEKVEEIRSQS